MLYEDTKGVLCLWKTGSWQWGHRKTQKAFHVKDRLLHIETVRKINCFLSEMDAAYLKFDSTFSDWRRWGTDVSVHLKGDEALKSVSTSKAMRHWRKCPPQRRWSTDVSVHLKGDEALTSVSTSKAMRHWRQCPPQRRWGTDVSVHLKGDEALTSVSTSKAMRHCSVHLKGGKALKSVSTSKAMRHWSQCPPQRRWGTDVSVHLKGDEALTSMSTSAWVAGSMPLDAGRSLFSSLERILDWMSVMMMIMTTTTTMMMMMLSIFTAHDSINFWMLKTKSMSDVTDPWAVRNGRRMGDLGKLTNISYRVATAG